MDQIVQQGKKINVLKALNNAIVTSRLYPPDAPQVANAVERGYKGLKLSLREQGSLLFSFQGDNPCLGGIPLEHEVLESFPNLVIYRQLRLLGLSQLLLGADMDRFAFGQIISVFNASLEKAKKAGGGMALVTDLGLASYFPEGRGNFREKAVDTPPEEHHPRKVVKIKPELLACLCGVETRPTLQAEIDTLLANSEAAVELLVAGVGYILRDIQKKGTIFASPLFPAMLQGAATRCGEQDSRQIIMSLSRLLVENLRETALCVLLSQDYPEGFGTMLYDGLIGFLPMEKLRDVLAVFRERLAQTKLDAGENSPQAELLDTATSRLLNTGKARQFLSSEKTRQMLHEGEVARKKRRVEAGLQGLLQGNANSLKSEELVQYLPEAVATMLASGTSEEVETLLKKIADSLGEGGPLANSTMLTSLLAVGKNLVSLQRFSLLDIILEPIMDAVRVATFDLELLERAVVFLHQVMQNSWSRGENRRGDVILALFYMIRSGQLDKSSALKGIIAKIQDKGIQRASLPVLLTEWLAAPEDVVGYRLVLQGPVAVRFLIEALINTETAEHRIKIIDLLTTNNSYLAPIICERLPEHMPWHGKRNLLKLLSETGQESDAESVLPYLKHEDFRVQREAFLCLYKIAGKSRKKLLLAALADSSELIKAQIIAALANIGDQEVASPLIEMLERSEEFSEKNRYDIMLQLLNTLGRCGCANAHKGVEAFLATRGQRSTRKIPEGVWVAAEKALAQLDSDLQEIRKKHLQAGQLRKNALKQVAKLGKGVADQRVSTGLPQEQTVRNFLDQGNIAAARDLLVQMIEKSARIRNFFQAESLREWLIEIDPTAFNQIIQVAEIIDREKMTAIDKSHLEIWSKLYERLTSEEFAAVYYAQKHNKYQNDDVVVSQGSIQTSLFFINAGKVKVYFEDKGQEVLLKTMGAGEVFGAGAFFEASVWTVSVASIGTSEISSLKLDKLEQWSEEFPGLESKLNDFCRKFERVEQFIERNSRDRRTESRHSISGRVSTSLVDERGQGLGISAMVELADISTGGLSYQARISKKENARLLLGRKVQVQLPDGEMPGEYSMVTGDILAVRSTYAVENDYSVHVKLDVPLSGSKLQQIIGVANRQARMR